MAESIVGDCMEDSHRVHVQGSNDDVFGISKAAGIYRPETFGS
jgi:hypothetical protein